jgi:thioredoxin 1
MPMTHTYLASEPKREELDRSRGPLVVEFGAAWCGICKAAQPAISKALSAHAEIQHLKVADGKGQPLGRSYRVKLWPTLIALRDGEEVGRLVRPTNEAEISQLLQSISGAPK